MDYAGGSQPPASEFVFEEKPGYIRFVQIRDYDTDSHITYIPESPRNKICDERDIIITRNISSHYQKFYLLCFFLEFFYILLRFIVI